MKTFGMFLLVAAVLSVTGCDDTGGGESGPADPATTSVSVHFTDSSVPPEYHRSWELTLDQDSVRLVVDSYGDIIADETVDMPAAEWEEFVSGLPDAVEALDPEDTDMCPGGTSMKLDVDGVDSESVEANNCGGSNDETMGEIRDLVEPFTDLVDLDKHT